jgi:hypothetical protein
MAVLAAATIRHNSLLQPTLRALALVPDQFKLAGATSDRSHAGKSHIAYEGGVPGFKPGTLVATGYAVSVVADGHRPTPDELAAALDAIEAKRSSERARGGA